MNSSVWMNQRDIGIIAYFFLLRYEGLDGFSKWHFSPSRIRHLLHHYFYFVHLFAEQTFCRH
jgi:hypothetical protein